MYLKILNEESIGKKIKEGAKKVANATIKGATAYGVGVAKGLKDGPKARAEQLKVASTVAKQGIEKLKNAGNEAKKSAAKKEVEEYMKKYNIKRNKDGKIVTGRFGSGLTKEERNDTIKEIGNEMYSNAKTGAKNMVKDIRKLVGDKISNLSSNSKVIKDAKKYEHEAKMSDIKRLNKATDKYYKEFDKLDDEYQAYKKKKFFKNPEKEAELGEARAKAYVRAKILDKERHNRAHEKSYFSEGYSDDEIIAMYHSMLLDEVKNDPAKKYIKSKLPPITHSAGKSSYEAATFGNGRNKITYNANDVNDVGINQDLKKKIKHRIVNSVPTNNTEAQLAVAKKLTSKKGNAYMDALTHMAQHGQKFNKDGKIITSQPKENSFVSGLRNLGTGMRNLGGRLASGYKAGREAHEKDVENDVASAKEKYGNIGGAIARIGSTFVRDPYVSAHRQARETIKDNEERDKVYAAQERAALARIEYNKRQKQQQQQQQMPQ